jgi:hypothetical protein
MSFHDDLNKFLIHNPKPKVIYLPTEDLLKIFPQFNSGEEWMKYQAVGNYGLIELKESTDNKIHIKY